MDEPTIGLDPQSRKHLWNYVLDLAKKENITIFLTTHYMEEAEHCSRIAIMDAGKIIALDTPEGLKRSIGGDVLTLKTADDEEACRIMRESLSLEPQPVGGRDPRRGAERRQGDPADPLGPADGGASRSRSRVPRSTTCSSSSPDASCATSRATRWAGSGRRWRPARDKGRGF